jgi:ribose-phosphate pyrophosphokinase
MDLEILVVEKERNRFYFSNSSEDLAKKISKKLKANLVKSEVKVFPDGESKITLKGKLSKSKTIIVQSIYPPVDSNLIQALSLISKANDYSTEVVVVVPYLGYARQDREFLPGYSKGQEPPKL